MAPKRRQGRGPTKAKAPSKPRQVLNLGSREERVVERAKIGRLRSALIQPATMVKYQNALAYFFRFLDAGGLELPSCQDDLDDVVCECIEYMWETGEGSFFVWQFALKYPLPLSCLVWPFEGSLETAPTLGPEGDSSPSSTSLQDCCFCNCPPVLPMGLPQRQHCAGACSL